LNPYSTKPNTALTYKLETLQSTTALIDTVSFTGTALSLSPN